MNKEKINIWGRDFNLKVHYDCYDDEEVYSEQEKALELFIKYSSKLLKSADKIKKYCSENNNKLLKEESIDNIFKYVMPNCIYVKRNRKKHVVAILCDYKFDEHGIAIVFENEKFKEICMQDYIL